MKTLILVVGVSVMVSCSSPSPTGTGAVSGVDVLSDVGEDGGGDVEVVDPAYQLPLGELSPRSSGYAREPIPVRGAAVRMSDAASDAFDSRPALRLTPVEAIGWLGVPAFPYPQAVGAFAAEGSVDVGRVSNAGVRRVDRISFVAAGSGAASLVGEFLDAADVTSDWFQIAMTEIDTTEVEGSPDCVEAVAEARSNEETTQGVVLSWTVGVCVYGGDFDGLAGVEVERVLLVDADELDQLPPASGAALAGAQSSGVDGLHSELVGWSVDWVLPDGGASSVESTVSYLVGGTIDEVASVLGDPGWQTVTSPARTTLFFGERSWVLTASGTDVVSATYSVLQ